MLKRTDSAAITKANVTVAYPTYQFISVSCNCSKLSCIELHGGSVVSEYSFLMPQIMA